MWGKWSYTQNNEHSALVEAMLEQGNISAPCFVLSQSERFFNLTYKFLFKAFDIPIHFPLIISWVRNPFTFIYFEF